MPTTATKPSLTGGRLAAVIAGGLILLLSAMSAVSGAGLSWASSKQDDAGYYTTDTERLAASTSAISTDDLDVDGVPRRARQGPHQRRGRQRQAAVRRHRPHA